MHTCAKYIRLLLFAALLAAAPWPALAAEPPAAPKAVTIPRPVLTVPAAVPAVAAPAGNEAAVQAVEIPRLNPSPEIPLLRYDYRSLKYLDMPVTVGEKWNKALRDNRVTSVPAVGMPDDGGPLAFSYTCTKLERRVGDHSLTFNASSVSYSQNGPPGFDVPVAGGAMALTYRYHGFLGGIVRPVVRLSSGISQVWHINTPWEGYNNMWQPWVMPEAGVEIVYKGVGLGFTTGWQFANEPDERELYYPWAAKRKRNFDWGKLLEGMIKNIYLILE